MLRMDISKYLQTSFYFLLCAFLHFSTLNWQLLHLPSAPSHLVLRTDAHRPCPAPSTLVQPPWTTASKTAGQTRWSGERTWCGLGQVPQTAACGTGQFFHTSLLQRWEEKANVNDVLVYRVYFWSSMNWFRCFTQGQAYPVLSCHAFKLCLSSAGMFRPTVSDPIIHGQGGSSRSLQFPCILPPSLPTFLGRINLMVILWPPSAHGGTVLSFVHCSC